MHKLTKFWLPALLILAAAFFGGRLEAGLLRLQVPAPVAALTAQEQQVFFDDARALAHGGQASEMTYDGDLGIALKDKTAQARQLETLITYGALAAAAVLSLSGVALAIRRIRPDFRARNRVEGWVAGLFIVCSVTAILTTVGIVASLVWESLRFFQSVPVQEFLFGLDWDPQIAMRSDQYASKGAFGAVPLFAGTFLIMVIAMIVAAPIGLFSAIYLSEYASGVTRSVVKPLLEILAGVPTVVYGFFAALTVGPLFRAGFNALGAALPPGPVAQYLMEVQNQMALVAGVVMGIMLIPFVSSLSDDIINAVPQSMRDGSLAMGATRSETVKKVVLPAALPGYLGGLRQGWAFAWRSLMAAELIAFSPALGLGLGQLLDQGRELSDMSLVMTTIIMILVVGIMVELCVFAPLERHVLRQRGLAPAGRS